VPGNLVQDLKEMKELLEPDRRRRQGSVQAEADVNEQGPDGHGRDWPATKQVQRARVANILAHA
jgi:hypothetical protein